MIRLTVQSYDTFNASVIPIMLIFVPFLLILAVVLLFLLISDRDGSRFFAECGWNVKKRKYR